MVTTATMPKSDPAALGEPSTLVLVVDRDEHARFIYRSMLQYAGFEVVTASDGDAGVQLCQHAAPMAIVMDVDPPTCPTLALPQALVRDARLRETTLIALTRRAMRHELQAIRALGFDVVLVKPVDPKRVVEAVRGTMGTFD
jgi:CheY-like chemotaxis protein